LKGIILQYRQKPIPMVKLSLFSQMTSLIPRDL